MDLNLVRVFVAVYETRSLTAAAARLHVTQPAVSQSLGRLRREFDDALFERAARAMVPTPAADAAYPALADSLAGIERTMEEVHGFDPARSRRTFRVALSELGEIGWLPRIARAVRADAPGVRIQVVPLAADQLEPALQRGSVDLAVTPHHLGGTAHRVAVKSEVYCAVMADTHPLADGPPAYGDYARAAHAVVAADSGAAALVAAQRAAGLTIEAAVSVQHFATLPALLVGATDLVATIPRSIATGWAARWPLAIHPLPFPMAPVELLLYRRSSGRHALALDWFGDVAGRAIGANRGDFATIQAGPPES